MWEISWYVLCIQKTKIIYSFSGSYPHIQNVRKNIFYTNKEELYRTRLSFRTFTKKKLLLLLTLFLAKIRKHFSYIFFLPFHVNKNKQWIYDKMFIPQNRYRLVRFLSKLSSFRFVLCSCCFFRPSIYSYTFKTIVFKW